MVERDIGSYPLLVGFSSILQRLTINMDPLGMIWEALVNYTTPLFLALSLIIGYLVFFLFFHRTEYWDSVDWAERFFFGFLVGIFSMIVCTFASVPLAFLLLALYLEQWFTPAFYFVPVFFLMFLVLFRVKLGVPLSSKRANEYLWAFLTSHRSYWPYLLMATSGVVYLWLGWDNPFFAGQSRSLWGGFLFVFNFAVFLTFVILTWFTVQLSSVPTRTSLVTVVELPVEVLKFYFFSFLRKKKSLSITKEQVYWV